MCSKAAEKAITNALRRDRREPLAALGEYVPAAATAAQQLRHDPGDNSARRDSNFALGRKPRGDYHETFSMAHVYYGVTALARFDARRCVLWFEDPLNTETVSFGGRSFPLAAYFSVPLAVMLAAVDVDAMKLTRIPNSVDTLSPNNRLVKNVSAIPTMPRIPYHTICGARGRGDASNSSDCILPYWSSHLDGAQSELIVPSSHSAHQNP